MNKEKLTVSAMICAAGKGERAGFGKNKLLAPLCGAPALFHTLKKFNIPEINEVIVVSSPSDFEEISALCKPFGYTVVIGGSTRTESVKNALKTVTGDIVLIHDGARPYLSQGLILKCIAEVKAHGSAVPAVKLTDTAVLIGENGTIFGTVDREKVYRVQTPQGFFTEEIRRAYLLAGEKVYTDDSSVYGEYIAPCKLFAGEESNVKLTYKEDYLRDMPKFSDFSEELRAGFGTDVHAFKDGDFVTLGGVEIPCDRGLLAHSDGDVLLHALMDALLSAAGLKDIGHYFPDSDKKFSGADSKELLKEVIKILKGAGYVPFNVSVTIQAEKPRLSPYIDEMVGNISDICGIDATRVAVAAGTCERLGFVGEGLGIAAYAAVLIKEV